MSEVKVCSKCKEAKPVEQFSFHKNGKRYPSCKKCVHEWDIAHYAANKKELRRRRAKQYIVNRGKILARAKIYAAVNKDLIRVRNAKWRAANKEKLERYYLANAERRKDVAKAYQNSEQGLATHRRRQAKRRAIKKGAAIGDMSEIKEWEKTWRTAICVKCFWCRKRFAGKDCHADHLIPLSKGGPHDIENLVISCQSCNDKKHAKMPHIFMKEIQNGN